MCVYDVYIWICAGVCIHSDSCICRDRFVSQIHITIQ